MGDEEGTTYFSYRGPSPHDVSNASQGNKNTLRSAHSGVSDRGDNSEITTLDVRQYQSSVPEMTEQRVLFLTPPYPGYFFPPAPFPQKAHGNGQLVTSYPSFIPPTIDKKGWNSKPSKRRKKSGPKRDTLKTAAMMAGGLFLVLFGVTIFMAVHYGNSFY